MKRHGLWFESQVCFKLLQMTGKKEFFLKKIWLSQHSGMLLVSPVQQNLLNKGLVLEKPKEWIYAKYFRLLVQCS